MKCKDCHRRVAPGQAWDTRIECWQHPDGSQHAYGAGLDTGPCGSAPARSILVWVKHRKCFYVAARREERGHDAVLGSELAQAALRGMDEDD